MSHSGVRRAKAAFSQWVRDPPGYRSSRKERERQLSAATETFPIFPGGSFYDRLVPDQRPRASGVLFVAGMTETNRTQVVRGNNA